jgi:hypothetical protein
MLSQCQGPFLTVPWGFRSAVWHVSTSRVVCIASFVCNTGIVLIDGVRVDADVRECVGFKVVSGLNPS